MNHQEFWSIIERCKNTDNDIVQEKMIGELAGLAPEAVSHFGQYISLYASLAQEVPAAYAACKIMNGTATDDTLLYFCLWLVAQGKTAYFSALGNPDTLAVLSKLDCAEFQLLMGVSNIVLDEMDVDLETTADFLLSQKEIEEAEAELADINRTWPEDEDAMSKLIPTLAPKLAEKYGFGDCLDRLSPEQKAEMEKDIADLLRETQEMEAATLDEQRRMNRERAERYLKGAATNAAKSPAGYQQIASFMGGLAKILSSERKMGFIDKEGNIVIAPEYDDAAGFHTAFCRVYKDAKWGYINKKGEHVVPLLYDEISEWGFQGGLSAVKQDGLWGAVDKKGKLVIPCLYTDISPFSEGLTSVCKNGKYAVADKGGMQKTGFIYDSRIVYLNGRSDFGREGKKGILDENGKEILPPTYTQIEPFFEYGYAMAINYDRENPGVGRSRMGFIDRQGNVIVPVIYEEIRRYERHPEKTVALLDGQWIPLDMSSFVVEKPKKK